MIQKIIALACTLLLASAISISISSEQERCMIVSSNDQDQFLKIDLKFERFDQQSIQEGYRVVLHNTETHEEEAFQVYEGTFRREFKLAENVVYRLCFKIVLTQYRKVSRLVEYNAGIKHKFSISESQIAVPEKLVKSQELKQTYTYLSQTRVLMDRVQAGNKKIKEEETSAFEAQKDKMEIFRWVTLLQVVVVCLFGGYQYFRLKNLIDRTHR